MEPPQKKLKSDPSLSPDSVPFYEVRIDSTKNRHIELKVGRKHETDSRDLVLNLPLSEIITEEHDIKVDYEKDGGKQKITADVMKPHEVTLQVKGRLIRIRKPQVVLTNICSTAKVKELQEAKTELNSPHLFAKGQTQKRIKSNSKEMKNVSDMIDDNRLEIENKEKRLRDQIKELESKLKSSKEIVNVVEKENKHLKLTMLDHIEKAEELVGTNQALSKEKNYLEEQLRQEEKITNNLREEKIKLKEEEVKLRSEALLLRNELRVLNNEIKPKQEHDSFATLQNEQLLKQSEDVKEELRMCNERAKRYKYDAEQLREVLSLKVDLVNDHITETNELRMEKYSLKQQIEKIAHEKFDLEDDIKVEKTKQLRQSEDFCSLKGELQTFSEKVTKCKENIKKLNTELTLKDEEISDLVSKVEELQTENQLLVQKNDMLNEDKEVLEENVFKEVMKKTTEINGLQEENKRLKVLENELNDKLEKCEEQATLQKSEANKMEEKNSMLIEQVDSLQKECTVCSKAKDHIGDRLESCLRELKQNGEHLDQMKAEVTFCFLHFLLKTLF